MKRNEWIAVVVLLIVTALTVAFGSPSEGLPHGEVALAAELTPSATTLPQSPTDTTVVPTARATQDAAHPETVPTDTAPASAPATVASEATDAPRAELPAASPTPTATATPTLMPTATPFPFDTRPDLERFVYVDQKVQHMYVFERGELVRDLLCSTGLPTDTTYTEAWEGYIGKFWGTFYAFGTYQDHAWYLYQSLGSILVHGLPYTEEDGYRTYQGRELLGVQPSSHGCIRLAPEDAQWFTQWNPEGVYMVITDPYLEFWR